MRKVFLYMILWCCVLAPGILQAQTQGDLYAVFQNPPANARPFVRWWWNGSYVTEKEILRELDVMKAAGIGGVEINTIGMLEAIPKENLANYKALPWLSPEWNRMVRVAASGARDRGITADLIVGSGWPFGGRFLEPSEQTKRITLVKKQLAGPQLFQAEVKSLLEGSRRSRDEVATTPQVVFLRLVPPGALDCTLLPEKKESAVQGGTIQLEVPAGQHTLYCGLLEEGFTHVKLGAPGADGPVVDHFKAAAVRKYLDSMSTRLSPSLGGRLGNALRAMFVDSLELDHANWTCDFPQEFHRRRGYELHPYLPFVLDWEGINPSTAGAEPVLRARYDFCKTLLELFQERFLESYLEWCHRNGVQGRIQAYGRETHPLEGSLAVDLPEGESWLWSDHDKVVPMPSVVNKYVSSAAHLAGKPWISFEAMTNAVPVFRETLEDIKLCYDMSLATGVKHPILHGFNYSPPEAGFPGWIRFGSYFNEQNSWWPYFHRWADYAARLTAVFEQSQPGPAAVAILGPRTEEWIRHGLLYQPFPEVAAPWYHYHLWQALQQNGVASEFVSEKIIQQSTVTRGQFRYGSREFEALLLQEVESLEPETARVIAEMAGQGVKVILLEKVPNRSPGLQDAHQHDLDVRQAMERVLQARFGKEAVLAAPRPTSSEEERKGFTRLGLPVIERRNLLEFAKRLTDRFALRRFLPLETASIHLSPVEYRAGDRRLYFLSNHSRTESLSTSVEFSSSEFSSWLWDPVTGYRSRVVSRERDRIPIQLGPVESCLLVFEPAAAEQEETLPAAMGMVPPPNRSWPLVGEWEVDFQHIDPRKSFQRKLEKLVDLSLAAGAPEIATFGGTAIYRKEFRPIEDGWTHLDLGQVFGVSEVTLNGKTLGVRWYGRHVYETKGMVKSGINQLEIRMTTMLGNYCKSLAPVNPVAKRWAYWFPPIASGLAGPVTLLRPDPPVPK